MLTCTVSSTEYWPDKLIHIVISWTGFDLYRERSVSTAASRCRATDMTGDHSIFQLWMRAVEPHWDVSATHVLINTGFWHLGTLTVVEQPVPTLDIITPYIVVTNVRIVCCSPSLIQTVILVAGVNTWGGETYYYETNREHRRRILYTADQFIQDNNVKTYNNSQ